MRNLTRNLLLSAAAGALMFTGQAMAQEDVTPPLEPREPMVTTTDTDTIGSDDEGIVGESDSAAIVAVERPVLQPGMGEISLEELDDMDIYSVGGEEIGEVEELIRRGGEVHAVMEINDSWFDWDDEEVLVPLHLFERTEDGLRLPITEEQANALEEYVDEVDDETLGDYRTVSEAYAGVD